MALPVFFHFARLPHEGTVFLLVACPWVRLAERQSSKMWFSAVGEM